MGKDWVIWLGCVLLLLTGGVLFSGVPNFQYGWEALSAVGTMGAVVVSLWLSGQSERRSRKESEERAKLVAARIHPVVENLNAHLAGLQGMYYFDNLDEPGHIEDMRDSIRYLKMCTDRISREDIESLVSIDIFIAGYLSRAIGEIDGVVNQVERETSEWWKIGQLMKEKYKETWGASLIDARDLLLQAAPSLDYAANKIAPRPDWQSIYEREHES